MDMTIEILFATAIKQKTSNYPYLDYEGFGLYGKEAWTKITDDYLGFEKFILNKFQNERLDKRDFQNTNKDVLVLTPKETLSDYLFFRCDGTLAGLYKNDKLDELYDEFINDNKQG